MIIAVEKSNGDLLGAVWVQEIDGELKIKGSSLKAFSIADIDGDDIFHTDEPKIRLQFNEWEL